MKHASTFLICQRLAQLIFQAVVFCNVALAVVLEHLGVLSWKSPWMQQQELMVEAIPKCSPMQQLLLLLSKKPSQNSIL